MISRKSGRARFSNTLPGSKVDLLYLKGPLSNIRHAEFLHTVLIFLPAACIMIHIGNGRRGACS